MSLWVDKYKPQKISDIVGNKVQIKKARLWLSNYMNKVKGTKLSLFIYGPPGIGKTTLSHLIFKSFNYDVIEFNASDIRNQKLVRENLKSIIGKVSISKLMGGNLLNGIIMDEVDGLSSGDKGGISELITFINPLFKVHRGDLIYSYYKIFGIAIFIFLQFSPHNIGGASLMAVSIAILFGKLSLYGK